MSGQCKCGSFAINDDPHSVLCDNCWRDVEIERLRKEVDATFAVGVNQETAQRLEEILGIKRIRSVQINMGYDAVTVVTVEHLVTVEQQEKLVQTLLAVESWVPVATIEMNNEEH